MAKKKQHTRKDGLIEVVRTYNGKRVHFYGHSSAEIDRKIALYKDDADKGPFFADVAEVYRDEVLAHLANGTRRCYEAALQRAVDEFGELRMRAITPFAVNALLERLKAQGYARNTASNQKTVISGVYNTWIGSDDWRGDYNPTKLIKIPRGMPKKERFPPTPEQLQTVRRALGEYHGGEPDAGLVMAAIYLYTGQRRGEVLALQVADIDFDCWQLRVSKAVEHISNQPNITTTKTAAGVRTVPILAPVRHLFEYFRGLPPQTYLVGLGTAPLSATQYNHRWLQFCRAHGMAHWTPGVEVKRRRDCVKNVSIKVWHPDVTAHQFRHEYATMLFEAGIPEEVAVRLVGHADATTIHKVYLHIRERMLQDATDRLNAYTTQQSIVVV